MRYLTASTIFFLLALAGCQKKSSVEAVEEAISHAARLDDVFLEKEMEVEIGWTKVSLFFGYADNLAACNEFVEAMRRDQPQHHYRCAIIAK